MGMNHENVAHEWAHMRAARGHNLNATMQTERIGKEQVNVGLLISYGTIIGIRIGTNDFLMSADSYSISTTRHQSYAGRALPGFARVFYMSGGPFEYGNSYCSVTRLPETIVNALEKRLERKAEAYAGLSSRAWKQRQEVASEIIHMLDQASGILAGELLTCLKFDRKQKTALKRLVKTFAAFKVDASSAVDEFRKKQEAARKRAEVVQRKKDAEAFADFIEGKSTWCPHSYKSGSQYLTVYISEVPPHREDGFLTKQVEVITSLGVRVPVADAIKGFRFYFSRCIDGGFKFRPWHRNGEQFTIERWQLESITEDGGVVIGCHRFSAKEIRRFLNQWMEVMEVGPYLPTAWFDPPYGTGAVA